MKPQTLFALAATLLASPVLGQTPATTMDHGAHGASVPMAGYMTAMDVMSQSMVGMASTGDADADFLLMMIPHHQSAIDMALVLLEHGDDPATRTLAEAIIATQEAEITAMTEMLAALGIDQPD
jgi:uncharacterized protein (DUF305 family)